MYSQCDCGRRVQTQNDGYASLDDKRKKKKGSKKNINQTKLTKIYLESISFWISSYQLELFVGTKDIFSSLEFSFSPYQLKFIWSIAATTISEIS